MTHDILLGVAIAAAAIAAIPIVGYPFDSGSWIDPYRSRGARWVVYGGGGVALVLFIVLARSSV
jgi:hypothetical protein